MAPNTLASAAAIAFALFNGASAALDPIVIKGNHFFFSGNGSQFYIKGIAYQTGVDGHSVAHADGYVEPTKYSDPLADTETCLRDIPFLQQAGANVIRTYALDPAANHDECMKALDDAGIYLLTDLSEPALSINRADPSWDIQLFERYRSVIDTMSKYDNTLGFIAGNEIANNLSHTDSAAYIKAAVRDMKSYIKQKDYRPMGVGYAADDDVSTREQVAAYLNCGSADESIDFWGYNIYSWCGDSDMQKSGYDERVKEFASFSVPVFFAEYGCNQGGDERKFSEVEALYSSEMTDVFSGGVVFEYFENENEFGLIKLDGDSVETMADFNNLRSQFAAATPALLDMNSYQPSNTAQQACPTVSAGYWDSASETLPPTPNQEVCDCMMSTLRCVAKDNIDDEEVGDLFDEVCGYNDGEACSSGINRNTTLGEYGAFSMCNHLEKLSYAFNAYYESQKRAQDACDFGGSATLRSGNPSSASSCDSIIAEASKAAASGGSGSGSGSNGSGSKKDSSAQSLFSPVVTVGAFGATMLVSLVGVFML